MPLGDFSEQAAAYAAARPTYPVELVHQLVADAAIAPGDPIVDLGAGTGIFTRLLENHGPSITALEPNADMRWQAVTGDPAAPSQVRWLNGTFEQTGLPDSSQAWAVGAQSFHWADPRRALPGIRRILRPQRLLTVLWNRRENEKNLVLAESMSIIRRHVPQFDEAYRNQDWAKILESTADFKFENRRSASHVIRMSRERYLDLWRSHNRLTTVAGPERFAEIIAEVTAQVESAGVEIDVPYICEAWSARGL